MNIKLFFLSISLALGAVFVVSPKKVEAVDPKASNPIIWKTAYNKFSSSNFYLRIGDKYFYGGDNIEVRSDPGISQSTLEVTWKENGVEMRLNMYFRKISGNMWEMYELRGYNGQSNGDWLYFKDSQGNKVTSLEGQRNFADERRFVPVNGEADAEIYCKDCSITAFITNRLPVSSYGYSVDFRIGDEMITVTNSPQTGYGVNALLTNSNGDVVLDQSPFTYNWSVENSKILSIFSSSIPYSDNKCAYDILPPCPAINAQISGVNPGVSRVLLDIVRKNDGVVVATGSFDVRVVDKNTPIEFNQPEPSKVDNSKEIEDLKLKVGRIENDVQEQKKELSGLSALIQSIIDFLSRTFGAVFNR
jgi:hypothetical protein